MPKYFIRCSHNASEPDRTVCVEARDEVEARQKLIDAGMIVGPLVRQDGMGASSNSDAHRLQAMRSNSEERATHDSMPAAGVGSWSAKLLVPFLVVLLIMLAVPRTRYMILPMNVDVNGGMFVQFRSGSSEIIRGEQVLLIPKLAPSTLVPTTLGILEKQCSILKTQNEEDKEMLRLCKGVLSEASTTGLCDLGHLVAAIDMLSSWYSLNVIKGSNATQEALAQSVGFIVSEIAATNEIKNLATASAISDASGNYILSANAGEYYVYARHSRSTGYNSQSMRWLLQVDTRDGAVKLDLHNKNANISGGT